MNELKSDYDDTSVMAVKFSTISQHIEKDQDAFLALSDFIVPNFSGKKDYIGFFALWADFNQDGVS